MRQPCPPLAIWVVQVAADVKPAVDRPIKAPPAVHEHEPATAAPSDPPDATPHATMMAKGIVETPPVCAPLNPPYHRELTCLHVLADGHTLRSSQPHNHTAGTSPPLGGVDVGVDVGVDACVDC